MGAIRHRRRRRYVIFCDHRGRRQNIHLGPVPSGDVTRATRHIKELVRSNLRDVPISDEAQQWLDYTERHVRCRLAEIGLLAFDEID